jgi:hypothetical protein
LEKSIETIKNNPMITAKANEYWKNKEKLIEEFYKAYAFDLGNENI